MATEDAVIDMPIELSGAYQMLPGMGSAQSEPRLQVLPREVYQQVHEIPLHIALHSGTPIHHSRDKAEVIQFAAVRDPRLRVVSAIPLNVATEEGQVIACWSEIDEFGVGETLSDALEDFSSRLRDLYSQLFSPAVKLGPDLQKIKKTIERHIQPRK